MLAKHCTFLNQFFGATLHKEVLQPFENDTTVQNKVQGQRSTPAD